MSELTRRDPAKRRYRRNIRNAVVVAVVLHAMLFAVAPPYVSKPFSTPPEGMRLVNAAFAGEGRGSGTGVSAAPTGPRTAAVPATGTAPSSESASFGGAVRSEPAVSSTPPTGSAAERSNGAGNAGEGGGASLGGGAAGGGGDGDDSPPLFYAYDSPPRPIRTVVPEYPPPARAAGAEGTVIVNVNVDPRGHVTRAWVASANTSESLIESAIDAAYRYEFTPGTQRDIPVPCTVAIPFRFTLRIQIREQ